MARLMIVLLFLTIVAGLAIGAASAVQRGLKAGRERVVQADMGSRTMQKLSFALLMALILYVAIWGGA